MKTREQKLAYLRQWRAANLERSRLKKIEYRKSRPGWFKEVRKVQRLRWAKRNPLKHRAHQIVADALRTVCHGRAVKPKLVRPKTCSMCGSRGRIEAHHDDYRKPLEVRWLCQPCHRKIEGRVALNKAARTQ